MTFTVTVLLAFEIDCFNHHEQQQKLCISWIVLRLTVADWLMASCWFELTVMKLFFREKNGTVCGRSNLMMGWVVGCFSRWIKSLHWFWILD